MTTTPITAERVLHEAADLLERNGWCQKALAIVPQLPRNSAVTTPDWVPTTKMSKLRELRSRGVACRCCALGAIVYAAGDDDAACQMAAGALQRVIGESWTIASWNDWSGQTVEEVTSGLRRAALAASAHT